MLLKSTVSSSASVSPVYGSDRGRGGPCLSLLGTLFEFSSTADAAAAAADAACAQCCGASRTSHTKSFSVKLARVSHNEAGSTFHLTKPGFCQEKKIRA